MLNIFIGIVEKFGPDFEFGTTIDFTRKKGDRQILFPNFKYRFRTVCVGYKNVNVRIKLPRCFKQNVKSVFV